MVLVGLSLGEVGRKHIFLLADLLPVLMPTYISNLKIICQGEVCKFDKPPSFSVKTLKNMTPEILATNIDWSQILNKTSVSNYCH